MWAEEIARWCPADAELFHWHSYSSVCKRVSPGEGKPAAVAVPVPRETLPDRWDTIICDEAHYLKGRSTTWTKAVSKLRGDRLYLATGTPFPNWGHEVFMLLRLLYPGDPRFTNYWRWVDEYFRTWKPPWGGTQIRGLHRGVTWDEAMGEWGLADRWLRRTVDEVLPDLPPMTTQTIRVKMTEKQARTYDQLRTEWLSILPDTGTEVVSWNDGGIYQKMLQCSTGLSTLDLGETRGSGKLDVLCDLMRDRTHPTIVFCAYTRTVEAVADALEGLGHQCGKVSSAYSMGDRLEAVRGFREGKFDCLVGTVGTLSEGVTLTRADTCIFVERSPKPTSNEQARRRIRRFGQERPTLSIDLVTEGTVDESLSKLLAEKSRDIELAMTGAQVAAMEGIR